jgi:hypothetical protein
MSLIYIIEIFIEIRLILRYTDFEVSMITPEQLIYDLQKQVAKLEEELTQYQQHLLDFELAAKEWKKGYLSMEKGYRVKLTNAEQTIMQLEEECRNWKSAARSLGYDPLDGDS